MMMIKISILLLLQNNLYLLTFIMKYYNNKIYLIDLEGILLVLEKKLVHMVKILGVYLEFINLKKLNSLLYVNQKNHGKNLIIWLRQQKNIIKV